ncbi:alpha/beta hydrolase [Pseudonocardia nigra]|uniref:alpha/beta hydrolase n=1 Tax=Pseudonocardia nigra TaxID=1921578 RepID=UPI001C5DF22A|nr:alpha/beta hydrolase [Pseudonocardia nigra]
MRPVRAVVLPGSGSDEEFVRAAFGPPLRALGVRLHAVRPRTGADVVAGYRAALDAALDGPGPLLVGGISLGAHVAAAWAAQRQHAAGDGLAGLLLALPAWTGAPDGAPAALAARAIAAQVRAGGVTAAVAAARAGSPDWLGAELARAWPRYGTGLAAALEAAAVEPAPDPAALRSVAVPAGIAGLVDDPVHPIAEARRWHRLLPAAALHTATLAAFGADPAVLGRAAVLGWLGVTTR